MVIKALVEFDVCFEGYAEKGKYSWRTSNMGLQACADEIIRCKDCKWFNTAGCVIEIVDKSDRPTEDGSCSFAERKEDE